MRYFLSFIVLILLFGCSHPDFDSSVQVESWLRSLDPSAEVIEVRCTGDIEYPVGSGKWTTFEQTDRWPANEVLGAFAKQGLDWSEMVRAAIRATEAVWPRWALAKLNENLGPPDRMLIKLNLPIENLHCEGKPLRSPPIQVGKCPNDTSGCDEPPMPTDLPPPLPPPPGGGDF